MRHRSVVTATVCWLCVTAGVSLASSAQRDARGAANSNHADVELSARHVQKRQVSGDASVLSGRTFDYVIVGGGTAGLAVARRLVENNSTVTVAVIEAGTDGSAVETDILAPAQAYFDGIANEDSEYDWGYNTVTQPGLNRTNYWPRGKVLGGSSAVNGLYMIRASQIEHDSWAGLIGGADMWGWDAIYPYMKKSENFTAPSDYQVTTFDMVIDESKHGQDGPIHYSYPGFFYPQTSRWIPTLANLGVETRDPADGNSYGAFIATSAINPDGWSRSYSKNGYLDPVSDLDNLVVLAGYQATKVVFDGTTATGVEFSQSTSDQVYTVNAAEEVILSAGVIGTPQLLQLSGIGDSSLLNSLDIDVVYDLPGVGMHLTDHLSAQLAYEASVAVVDTGDEVTTNATYAAEQLELWQEGNAWSLYNSPNHAVAYVNLTTLMGEDGAASLIEEIKSAQSAQVEAYSTNDAVRRGYNATYSAEVDDVYPTAIGQAEILLSNTGAYGAYGNDTKVINIQAAIQHPLSRGSVTINSASAFDAPAIDPQYLAHPADIKILIAAFKFARTVAQTQPLAELLATELNPGPEVQTDEQWEEWIRASVSTEYHPGSTASMLPEENGGVVDNACRVYGVTGLRVIDASIVPVGMSAHMTAPLYGIAERAYDLLMTQPRAVGGSPIEAETSVNRPTSSSSSGVSQTAGASRTADGAAQSTSNEAAAEPSTTAEWISAMAPVTSEQLSALGYPDHSHSFLKGVYDLQTGLEQDSEDDLDEDDEQARVKGGPMIGPCIEDQLEYDHFRTFQKRTRNVPVHRHPSEQPPAKVKRTGLSEQAKVDSTNLGAGTRASSDRLILRGSSGDTVIQSSASTSPALTTPSDGQERPMDPPPPIDKAKSRTSARLHKVPPPPRLPVIEEITSRQSRSKKRARSPAVVIVENSETNADISEIVDDSPPRFGLSDKLPQNRNQGTKKTVAFEQPEEEQNRKERPTQRFTTSRSAAAKAAKGKKVKTLDEVIKETEKLCTIRSKDGHLYAQFPTISSLIDHYAQFEPAKPKTYLAGCRIAFVNTIRKKASDPRNNMDVSLPLMMGNVLRAGGQLVKPEEFVGPSLDVDREDLQAQEQAQQEGWTTHVIPLALDSVRRPSFNEVLQHLGRRGVSVDELGSFVHVVDRKWLQECVGARENAPLSEMKFSWSDDPRNTDSQTQERPKTVGSTRSARSRREISQSDEDDDDPEEQRYEDVSPFGDDDFPPGELYDAKMAATGSIESEAGKNPELSPGRVSQENIDGLDEELRYVRNCGIVAFDREMDFIDQVVKEDIGQGSNFDASDFTIMSLRDRNDFETDEEDDDRQPTTSSDMVSTSPSKSPSKHDGYGSRTTPKGKTRFWRLRQGGATYACDRASTGGFDRPGPNEDIAKVLDRFVQHYKGDQWRERGYKNAASALRNTPYRVDTFQLAKKIDGVGDKIARRIVEIARFGTTMQLERASPDNKLIDLFSGIYGVGRPVSEQFIANGARSLEDLRREPMKFGMTTSQQLGLKYYDELQERIPRAEVGDLFKYAGVAAKKIDRKLEVYCMGSYRRVLITRDPSDGITHRGMIKRLWTLLEEVGMAKHVLTSPDSWDDLDAKVNALCALPQGGKMRRLDILGVPYDELPAALIYFTGNDYFNRSMRLKARHLGYRLNQRGLYKDVSRARDGTKLTHGQRLWIVWPSFDYRWSRQLLWTLGPFNLLLAILYYNYALCVLRNPGRVPAGWRPDKQDLLKDGVEVKKLTGSPRYCRTCQAYKPPRAHHCGKCKACTLKMDHHCPWVNNCIGHGNYAHFIRFLTMVDVACSYHLWMISKRAFGSMAFSRYPTNTQMIMLVLNYVACVPVLLAVGALTLYHYWCLLFNTTTIEGWEKDKVATLRRQGKILEYKYPYHLGYWANIQSVLGNNPILWCLPGQATPGTGLHHPVGVGVDPVAQYDWPPQYVKQRLTSSDRQQRRRELVESSPFTYGDDLNPELLLATGRASTVSHVGTRSRPKASHVAPYHPDYEREESFEKNEFSGDDDDVPLGRLARAGHRRTINDAESGSENDSDSGKDDTTQGCRPSVRIRRGSEGYEIRPSTLRYALDSEPADVPSPSFEDNDANEGWEKGNRRESLTQRYNVYVPEPESASSDEWDEDSDS
ncbi:hypothetical protein OIO90_000542 [Microbotryomycetes sp. JL221]|nr:hypothetical protein OIO90_000542 [Microbotryomycetes sp. JL221]